MPPIMIPGLARNRVIGDEIQHLYWVSLWNLLEYTGVRFDALA